jgi:cyclic lactone autoinducer peptide
MGKEVDARMKKLIPMAVTLISALAVLLATTTAYASPPFAMFQPKAPKSLIK